MGGSRHDAAGRGVAGGRGDGVEFVGAVLTNLDRQSLSWKLSDRFPLWTEFLMRDK